MSQRKEIYLLMLLNYITYYSLFCMIYCYVISEWTSHSWHNLLVQNSSKCKPTKIYQIYIKCIEWNKKNNKQLFNPSLENTFIVFVWDIWLVFRTRQIYLQKHNSGVLHIQIEQSFVLIIILYILFSTIYRLISQYQSKGLVFCEHTYSVRVNVI